MVQKAVTAPDFQDEMDKLQYAINLYTQATTQICTKLELDAVSKREFENILEWIWPKDKWCPVPISRDDLCFEHSFLKSTEYKSWVGLGSPTVLCKGRRTYHVEECAD